MGDTADELHPGVHMFHSSPKSKVEAPSVFKICFLLYTHNDRILGLFSKESRALIGRVCFVFHVVANGFAYKPFKVYSIDHEHVWTIVDLWIFLSI